MVRKIMVILALGVGCSVARAVYDPHPVVSKGRRWSLSTGLRTGYDDNTTATENGKGSFFNGFNVSGTYSYPTDTSFLSVHTQLNGEIYNERQGSGDFDFGNAFDFVFAHTFSPRLNLDATDHLRFGQEPQLGDNNAILRRTGDYVNNAINFGLSYQLTGKWFADMGLSHDIWTYDDAQVQADLGRQSIGVAPGVRYRLTEKLSLNSGYSYTRTEYDQSPRSSNTHSFTVGASQVFSRRWSANGSVGGELRQEDGPLGSNSFMTPFFSLGTSYLLNDKITLSLGTRYSFQETDLTAFFASRTISSFGNITWNIFRNVNSSTGLTVLHSDYSDLSASTGTTPLGEGSEIIYVFDQNISWQIRQNISLTLKYTHTEVDSDFALRGYSRNRTELGASYQF